MASSIKSSVSINQFLPLTVPDFHPASLRLEHLIYDLRNLPINEHCACTSRIWHRSVSFSLSWSFHGRPMIETSIDNVEILIDLTADWSDHVSSFLNACSRVWTVIGRVEFRHSSRSSRSRTSLGSKSWWTTCCWETWCEYCSCQSPHQNCLWMEMSDLHSTRQCHRWKMTSITGDECTKRSGWIVTSILPNLLRLFSSWVK